MDNDLKLVQLNTLIKPSTRESIQYLAKIQRKLRGGIVDEAVELLVKHYLSPPEHDSTPSLSGQ